jgi:UDP-N-acetylmuramate: L-alanyl-gamma-D-glutamyl-meso-diaminopimelate ligase
VKEGSTAFSVRRKGEPSGSFEVPLLGAYNVRNALAAIAVGAAVGLNMDTMAAGLRAFKGVRRRMQLRGTARGVAVYDDFAHHPTAIAETLAGVRSAYPDRQVWAIFEPRSATSCRRIFQEEFARAFSPADRVLIPAVFRSSLPEDQRLSAERLIADLKSAGKDARHIPEVDDIVAAVAKDANDGDLVIVMSNGGFDNIHQKLLTALEARAR